MPNLCRRTVLAALAGVLLVASAAQAGDRHGRGDEDDDHDAARGALERGEILPLGAILDRVEGQLPGRILEVEFERDDDLWVYEFTVLRGDGRRVEVYVDAATAAILRDED